MQIILFFFSKIASLLASSSVVSHRFGNVPAKKEKTKRHAGMRLIGQKSCKHKTPKLQGLCLQFISSP